MSYIRKPNTLKTGFQESQYWSKAIDLHCDFVMVYGFSSDLESRIKSFKSKGYVIHFMTGIAWGEYQDYLNGQFDGLVHWDDAQMDCFGKRIIHGTSEDIPYMVPTYAFIEYMVFKLKQVVDLGVEAIHLEEPEFWSHAGYSTAFKREYEVYFGTPWVDPKNDYKVLYRVQMLKAKLYQRALNLISERIKLYALERYQSILPVYIPTHSLINYSQWKIMSPESQLIGLPSIDGFIAQVWTGTSREPNVYKGIKKERTFETAYLEYSIMASFQSKKQKLWFLHDPIEDNPGYDWTNYQYNYEKTLIASLLIPSVNTYEICPWPTRIFDRKLPAQSIDSTYIPKSYDVYLNQIFQLLGDVPISSSHEEEVKVAILFSDTAMYHRENPIETDLTFSDFYGLALPLIKRGISLQFVTVEQLLSDTELNLNFDILVMSYDFMKPTSPAFHYVLMNILGLKKSILYVGNQNEPYAKVYDVHGFNIHPFEHLNRMFSNKIESNKILDINGGHFISLNIKPSRIAYENETLNLYIKALESLFQLENQTLPNRNYHHIQRGPYEMIAVMEECDSNEPFVENGLFVDLRQPTFNIVKSMYVPVDEIGIYYRLKDLEFGTIIGSTYRIINREIFKSKMIIKGIGKTHIEGHIRIFMNKKPIDVNYPFIYDFESKTLLVSFLLTEPEFEIIINYK